MRARATIPSIYTSLAGLPLFLFLLPSSSLVVRHILSTPFRSGPATGTGCGSLKNVRSASLLLGRWPSSNVGDGCHNFCFLTFAVTSFFTRIAGSAGDLGKKFNLDHCDFCLNFVLSMSCYSDMFTVITLCQP